MKVKTAFFLSLAVLLLAPQVHAAESHVSIKNEVNTSSSNSYSNSSSTNIHVESNGGGTTRVVINNGKFEIEGKVDSIGSDSFVVSGQKIYASSALIGDSKNSGKLKIGNQVEVKGDSKSDGTLVATSINGVSSSSYPTSTPTNKPSTSHTPTPTSSLTNTPTPSTSSADIEIKSTTNGDDVKIEISGPKEKIIAFFKLIAEFFDKLF